jgi:hypothetical protein
MIDDLQEKMSSEKESDDESIFEYENELIDGEDKKSDSSREENELNSEIVKD